jgi:hypothetical protein
MSVMTVDLVGDGKGKRPAPTPQDNNHEVMGNDKGTGKGKLVPFTGKYVKDNSKETSKGRENRLNGKGTKWEGKMDQKKEHEEAQAELRRQRECAVCNESFHCRRMEATYETYFCSEGPQKREGTSGEKEDRKKGDQYSHCNYVCVDCVADRDGKRRGGESNNRIWKTAIRSGLPCS